MLRRVVSPMEIRLILGRLVIYTRWSVGIVYYDAIYLHNRLYTIVSTLKNSRTMKIFSISTVWFSVVTHLFCGNMLFAQDGVDELADKVINSRMLITSGSMSVENKRDEENAKTTTHKLKVWFDSDHYRCDAMQLGENATYSDVGFDKIQCWNCEKKDHYLSAIRGPFTASIKKMDNYTNMLKISTVDMRILGFDAVIFPNFGMRHDNIRTELKNRILTESCTGYKVRKMDSGLIALQSTYRTVDATRVMEIDPEKNFFITSIRIRSDRNMMHYATDLTVSKVEEIVKDRIWYPLEIKLIMTINNKAVLTEVITVSDLQINNSINANIFTLAGMNLANGTVIKVPDTDGPSHRIIDGKIISGNEYRNQVEVEVKKNPQPPSSETPVIIPVPIPNATPSPRWPYALGAGIFAIVTVFFLRRLIISRTG